MPLVLWIGARIFLQPDIAVAQVAQSPLFIGSEMTAGCGMNCSENCRGTGTLPSLSSPTLTADTLFVQSGFFTRTWEGYVRAYDAKRYLGFLGGNGPEPAPAWTANFPAPSERNIQTSSSQTSSVAFEWCSLAAVQRALLEPAGADVPCSAVATPLVLYLRGDATHERRNGGPYRDRPDFVLGDVVNSTPVFSHAMDHAYQLRPVASYSSNGVHGFSTYRTYVQAKTSSRIPVVMFGANDGMFHVLDARTGLPSSGREIFAYVPRSAFAGLRALSDPYYTHRYLVDGPVIEGDVWNGTAWRTIVIATTGAGAAGVFAIDVTSPGSSMDARSVMWDITAADHSSAIVRDALGLTLGAGVIGSVRFDHDGSSATLPNGAWAYVVGNGYESRNDTAALLVFNALDGSLIRAIDTGVGGAGGRNGLGAVTPVYDGNRNIVTVYAGDKLGNLWKFDLSSANPSGWRIFNELPGGAPGPLFAATNSGMVRPIHQVPRLMPDGRGGFYVAIGTGKYFEIGDPENSDDQGIFVLRDQGQKGSIAFGELAMVRTEEYTAGSSTLRRLYQPDLKGVDWNGKGFWVRLRPLTVSSSKERVIGPLFLDAGMLVVSTFSPGGSAESCPSFGRSYLYRIDLSNGFSRGAFGAEAGTTIGLRLEAGTAGGLVPLYQPAAADSELVHTLFAADLEALLASSRYQITSDGEATRRAGAGRCLHALVQVDGSAARVETNCAGLLPLRSWRPMK